MPVSLAGLDDFERRTVTGYGRWSHQELAAAAVAFYLVEPPDVLLLARDLHIRVINAATGELVREVTLNPARDYQPTGRRPGPTSRTPGKSKHPEP